MSLQNTQRIDHFDAIYTLNVKKSKILENFFQKSVDIL